MKYQLVAIDADGTLLNDKSKITQENKDALVNLSLEGVKVVISSGRSMVNMEFILKELNLIGNDDYAISFNGSIVHHLMTNKQLLTVQINKQTALTIIEYGKTFDVGVVVYPSPNSIFVSSIDGLMGNYLLHNNAKCHLTKDFLAELPNLVFKVMFVGEQSELIRLQKYIAATKDLTFNSFLTSPNLLEFTHKDATKGDALEFLCNHLSIPLEQTIAIGDSCNDISMLKRAGLGVAMANASSEVKKNAHLVSKKSNNHSGVAEIIHQCFFSEEMC